MIFVTQGVAGRDVFDSDDGRDVARVAGFDVLALVSLNLNQTRNALALIRARIVNGVAFTQSARVNPEENQLADKWIAPELERDRAKGRVVVRDRFHRLMSIGVL